MQRKIIVLSTILVFMLFLVVLRVKKLRFLDPLGTSIDRESSEILLSTPEPLSTPTPTPKPLTFTEMNNLYGPCAYLPTLMYHHVQDPKVATDNHQASISVNTDIFREQMKYLKEKGYRSASISEIINLFDSGTPFSQKSVLITFDDGYEDFYFNAYPILRENGFGAIVFLPTGLMNNFGYLNWSEISEMSGSGIYFANHTWSHKSAAQAPDVIEKEITLADTQLAERGLNNLKIFAYPYGTSNMNTKSYLTKLDYKLAFTTKYGSALCAKQRFELPRIRVGNKSMSLYGF